MMNQYRFFTSKGYFNEEEQAAMADAKQALKSVEESVIELNNYNDWVPVVMKSEIPVILD